MQPLTIVPSRKNRSGKIDCKQRVAQIRLFSRSFGLHGGLPEFDCGLRCEIDYLARPDRYLQQGYHRSGCNDKKECHAADAEIGMSVKKKPVGCSQYARAQQRFDQVGEKCFHGHCFCRISSMSF